MSPSEVSLWVRKRLLGSNSRSTKMPLGVYISRDKDMTHGKMSKRRTCSCHNSFIDQSYAKSAASPEIIMDFTHKVLHRKGFSRVIVLRTELSIT